jgi:hypothetical protein
VENIPSLQGNLGRKISKNRQNYYPAFTNEIAPPRPIDGNPTLDLEQCSGTRVETKIFVSAFSRKYTKITKTFAKMQKCSVFCKTIHFFANH